MRGSEVWVFFYGSYINFEVLAEVDLHPTRWERARLAGYALTIAPRANLIAEPSSTAYGILAAATHAELGRLYDHARDILGERYLPQAVLARADDGAFRPALCYISHDMAHRPAADDYIDRILVPARGYGFPEEYLATIEGFRPS